MVEMASLHSLHEHAVQHGRSVVTALRHFEEESAEVSHASALDRSQLLNELHQARATCSRFEHVEEQLALRFSACENTMRLEANQAEPPLSNL